MVRDCRALGNCAAVCKRWVPRSRSLQWGSLDFSDFRSLDFLRSLLALASSSHATITPHIKRFTVPLVEGVETSDEHRLPNGQRPILMRIFMGIPTIYALRSISVFGIFTSGVEGEVIADVLGSLTQLKSLELANFTLDSFAVLQQIVASCPGLESLYVSYLRERSEPTRPPPTLPPPPPCPPLRFFSSMDCTFTARLLAWIGEGAQASRPGFIFMGGNDAYKHQRRFGSFLRNLGPELKALCIEQNDIARWESPRPGELPSFIHLTPRIPW